MEPNRFAALLLAAGSALGVASANLVPTTAVSAPAPYPSALAQDYPEITAVSYENIPGPVAPIIHHGAMRLASWEKPWLEPPLLPAEADYPQVQDDTEDSYQPVDDPDAELSHAELPHAELVDEPVEVSLTLSGHP